jgi:hypothetical protein
MNRYLISLALISSLAFSGCNSTNSYRPSNEHITLEGSIISVDAPKQTIQIIVDFEILVFLDEKTIIIDGSGGQYDIANLKPDMRISINGTRSESGRISAQSITILPSPTRILPTEIIPPEHD